MLFRSLNRVWTLCEQRKSSPRAGALIGGTVPRSRVRGTPIGHFVLELSSVSALRSDARVLRFSRNGFEHPTSHASGFPAILAVLR